jgi:FAD/FMN-containing dehydrogenase
LRDRTSFPNTTAYDIGSQYWSAQQAAVRSACRVSPTTSEEVSITLKTVIQYQCKFAVKSGGHAAFAGASGAEGGVTIDLRKLNEITVSDDKTVTRLGPGNTWFDVYSTLETQGLAVVGGRVADIGVGGLLLGGGISFFSGRYGTACDNILNFEVSPGTKFADLD